MDHGDKLLPVPLHPALSKPALFMGGDREMMMFTALISVTMIVVALSLQSAAIGIIVWIVFSNLLRMMAKADPLMRKIYIKQINYKKYYPSHSTPFVKEP